MGHGRWPVPGWLAGWYDRLANLNPSICVSVCLSLSCLSLLGDIFSPLTALNYNGSGRYNPSRDQGSVVLQPLLIILTMLCVW